MTASARSSCVAYPAYEAHLAYLMKGGPMKRLTEYAACAG